MSRLRKSDRGALAEARVNGLNQVVVVIASKEGANPQVAAELKAEGASIRYREDSVDYLSAILPAARVERIARLPTVDALNVDRPMQELLSSKPSEWAAHTLSKLVVGRPVVASAHLAGGNAEHALPNARFDAPSGDTPKENGFLATKDVGAPQFIAAHPTFDGRGVTIAIIDTGIEVLVPELQIATTLDGRSTPKIIDWLTSTDPLDDELPLAARIGSPVSCRWIDMRSEVVVNIPAVRYGGANYLVPGPGRYRIGVFDERANCRVLKSTYFLAGDVNRDGNPPNSSGLFGVLWNDETGEVWIDTDQDHSFVDERAMHDYARKLDVREFGTDDPRTPVRETVPFVIQIDRKRQSIYIGISVRDHGTLVTGSAAGRGYFDGAFDGVAPGAQLISVSDEDDELFYFLHPTIEAAILVAKDTRVDIVGWACGVFGSLNDGRLVLDLIVDRLIERYGKPFFISAGNIGPGMNTVGAPSNASSAYSVGMYMSRDTWYANFGARVARDDYLLHGARGPREDGALKPDFVAPTYALTNRQAVYHGRTHTGHMALPPGYMIGGGTSQAAPFASGVGALLVSAAKQTGLPYDPRRLRTALLNGSRFITDHAAYEQGSGLLQVGPAWTALQKFRDAGPVTIVTTGPVRTVMSSFLQTPHQGPGLYEREGWTLGMRETRTIKFTRTSGPDREVVYGLRWLGNDGTFSTQAAVTLRFEKSVDVPIAIAPTSGGPHSAILQVVDEGLGLVIHQVPTTIVVAEQFEASRGYQVRQEALVPRPGATSRFFFVPPGTAVFNVDVNVTRGPIRVRVHKPNGQSDLDTFRIGYIPSSYQSTGNWNRAFPRPESGVWEIVLEGSEDMSRLDTSAPSPLPNSVVALTVSVFGAELSIASERELADAPVGVRRLEHAIVVRNRFAPFAGRVSGSAMGTTSSLRLNLDERRSQAIRDIVVPAGTERLLVDIADVSGGRRADLDLYLFDCSGTRCELRAWANTQQSAESLDVQAPAAGMWKAVIDGFALSPGVSAVHYRDVILHPRYGQLEVSDSVERREGQLPWIAISTTQVEPVLKSNRSLIGLIEVTATSVNEIQSRGSYKEYARPEDATIQRPAPLARIAIYPERKGNAQSLSSSSLKQE